jgi:hypothetical protein
MDAETLICTAAALAGRQPVVGGAASGTAATVGA